MKEREEEEPDMQAMEKFWRGVRQTDPADESDISMGEAARRLRAGGEDPFSEEAIAAMVTEVTGEAVEPERQIRRMGGWRKLAAAAVLVVGVVGLMSTGVKFVFWPSGQNSSQTLVYDDANYVLVDEDEDHRKRVSAMATTYDFVRSGIRTIRRLPERYPELAGSGEEYLAAFSTRLNERPCDQWVAASSQQFLQSESALNDPQASPGERAGALRSMAREVAAGITCLLWVADNSADELLRKDTGAVLSLLRAKLK